MAVDFFIKQNDRLPEIESILLDGNGDVVAIPDGVTVRFIMLSFDDDPGDTPLVDAEATVVDGDAGHVKYQWQDGDTDEAGVYRAEWELQYSGVRLGTWPNNRYMKIKITADLGGVE